jgi:lycopene beta-cyclase
MLKTFNTLRYSTSTRLGLIVWALTMFSLPIMGWIMGDGFLERGMFASVLIQTAIVLVILYASWGWRQVMFAFIVVTGLSYFAELLGISTGFPFGKYHYTALLQPQAAGVPLLVPLAWMMLLPPAWAVSRLITRRSGRSFRFLIVSALAFTAWDLFLDPQMVAWNFWHWDVPGQYFGIPWSNYFGWILVSALLTYLVNPRELPYGLLSLFYVLTWIIQTLGQGIFWQQPGPALCGFLVSGFFACLAFWRGRDEHNTI